MTTHARSLRSATFDPDEIRRIVQRGKNAGLIREPGVAAPIPKDGGTPIAREKTLRSLWMDIDPPTARRWLDNNFRNRPLKDDVVTAYARDMQNGVWVATHQGIAFNEKDDLIDGQHRLHAIVRSGKTVRMMVTFGLPARIDGAEMTTMDAVDRGRTRTVADQLTIQHGFANAGVTAAICMSVAGLCYGERTRRLSVGQTLEIFRAFEGLVLWVIEHRSKEHGLKAAGVLAAFAFAMGGACGDDGIAGEAVEKIQAMHASLMTGENLRKRGAMAALRAFLTSDEAKLLSRGTDRGIAELVLQAILLEQKKAPVDKLDLADDGVRHFRALQPARVQKIAAMFQLPDSDQSKIP